MENMPVLKRSKRAPMSLSELRKWVKQHSKEDVTNCEIVELCASALDEEAPIERMALPLSMDRAKSIESQRAVLVLRLETEDVTTHNSRRLSSDSDAFFIYYLLCVCDRSTLLTAILRNTVRLNHLKSAPKRHLPYVYSCKDSLPLKALPSEKIVKYAGERLKLASKAVQSEDSDLLSLAEQLQELFSDAQSDLLSVHLATACLSASYHLDNRQKFADAEGALLYQRMLLRGVSQSDAEEQSRKHRENIAEDILASSIHFMARPLEDKRYLNVVQQAVQAWSAS